MGLAGGGDQVDIVKGDACFQSYICHIPRSTVELGLLGELDCLDGFVFPSTCDVIRNLSGIWQIQFPGKYVRFLDLPQTFDPETGGKFYERDLEEMIHEIAKLGGREPSLPKRPRSRCGCSTTTAGRCARCTSCAPRRRGCARSTRPSWSPGPASSWTSPSTPAWSSSSSRRRRRATSAKRTASG